MAKQIKYSEPSAYFPKSVMKKIEQMEKEEKAKAKKKPTTKKKK